MTILIMRELNYSPLIFNGVAIPQSHTLKILVTIDQKLSWTRHVNTMLTRAGQSLGILWEVTYCLTPQTFPPQFRTVIGYSLLAWMSAAPTNFPKNSIQLKAAPDWHSINNSKHTFPPSSVHLKYAIQLLTEGTLPTHLNWPEYSVQELGGHAAAVKYVTKFSIFGVLYTVLIALLQKGCH